MCGIYCSIGRTANVDISTSAAEFLRRRGPDYCETRHSEIPGQRSDACVNHIRVRSSVLALRGACLVRQPMLDDESRSLLCWNGEAWEIGSSEIIGNDSEIVFERLLSCTTAPVSDESAHMEIIHFLSTIRGPYALIFVDIQRSKLYFARDCLGRRSLVKAVDEDNTLIIASVSDQSLGLTWTEVEADGVYCLDLAAAPINEWSSGQLTHVPQRYRDEQANVQSLILPFYKLNKSLPHVNPCSLEELDASVQHLRALLLQSMKLRITNIHTTQLKDDEAHFAILFSGGLDCTLLTALAGRIIPAGSNIDLLNVAFENPRIHKDKTVSAYELCPDRITARASFSELQMLFSSITFRLICINIPFTETEVHRQNIIDLMHPHNTEMDFSIACALYFAARGSGIDSKTGNPYTSTARVLLSGLGADELFGGYQRHAIAYDRGSFHGLVQELELDFSRLGKRNLGRDDRVISHWGKEARYPYLDENVVAWALQTPVWLKTGFGHDVLRIQTEISSSLEPGKLVLRLMANEVGLRNAAREKKRAIQFGARTAKMQSGKVKGTQALS